MKGHHPNRPGGMTFHVLNRANAAVKKFDLRGDAAFVGAESRRDFSYFRATGKQASAYLPTETP